MKKSDVSMSTIILLIIAIIILIVSVYIVLNLEKGGSGASQKLSNFTNETVKNISNKTMEIIE